MVLDDIVPGIDAIEQYLRELLSEVPDEVAYRVRALQAVLQRARHHLEQMQRHQALVDQDIKQLLSEFEYLRTVQTGLGDATQKLSLISALLNRLNQQVNGGGDGAPDCA